MKARLLKSVNPQLFIQAQNLAKGTGWYYRDVLERGAAGKLIFEQEEHKITTPTAHFFSTTYTPVTQNQETYIATQASTWDNNSFRDAAFPTRMVAKAAGLYLCGADVYWPLASGANLEHYRLWVNRTYLIGGQTEPGNATANHEKNLLGLWYFHANDYLEASVLKNNSGNRAQLRNIWMVGITPESIIP